MATAPYMLIITDASGAEIFSDHGLKRSDGEEHFDKMLKASDPGLTLRFISMETNEVIREAVCGVHNFKSQENHNHLTRDIKAPGQCYSCDRYRALSAQREIAKLKNVIYDTLQSVEQHGFDRAFRYLKHEAQAHHINDYVPE